MLVVAEAGDGGHGELLFHGHNILVLQDETSSMTWIVVRRTDDISLTLQNPIIENDLDNTFSCCMCFATIV